MAPTRGPLEDKREANWRALLVKPGCLLLTLVLLEQPRRSFQEAVKATGLSTTAAEYHVRAMERDALVLVERLPTGRMLRLANRRLTVLLLDELVPKWSEPPIVAGELWRYLQERVQRHRHRVPTPWFQRPSLRGLR
ncbi:MAG: hypothetical protein AABX89_07465 [Candidatus Thermoplasmatota archaeon]